MEKSAREFIYKIKFFLPNEITPKSFYCEEICLWQSSNINLREKKNSRSKIPWTCFLPHDPLAYPSAELYHEEWSEWLPVTWRGTQKKFFPAQFKRIQKLMHKAKIVAKKLIPIWRICEERCQKLKSIISYIEILLRLPKHQRKRKMKKMHKPSRKCINQPNAINNMFMMIQSLTLKALTNRLRRREMLSASLESKSVFIKAGWTSFFGPFACSIGVRAPTRVSRAPRTCTNGMDKLIVLLSLGTW